jgi:pilus assembly protein Flp/PilA
MRNLLLTLLRDHRAATAVEYAIIAAMIAVAVASSVAVIGGKLKNGFTNISNRL